MSYHVTLPTTRSPLSPQRLRAGILTGDGHITPQLPLRPPGLFGLWLLSPFRCLARGRYRDLARVHATFTRGQHTSTVFVREPCCLGQARRVAAPALDGPARTTATLHPLYLQRDPLDVHSLEYLGGRGGQKGQHGIRAVLLVLLEAPAQAVVGWSREKGQPISFDERCRSSDDD